VKCNIRKNLKGVEWRLRREADTLYVYHTTWISLLEFQEKVLFKIMTQ
jgi:hypothetical protein